MCSRPMAHRRDKFVFRRTLFGRTKSSLRATGASPQQLHWIGGFLLELIERALPWRLVRPPAQDGGAVAKPLAAEMIVRNLDDEFRLQWAPLRRAFGRPAAWAARRIAGKPGFCDQRLKLRRQRRLFLLLDRRAESDMVQQSLIVVESEQQ